ncbi:helix-turn-helix transcriptional regulator [Emticicia sp. 17c]|uniref:helix-turn-helix transcriptional regulator n=1 Tax=Emticicia sp. 17c TaxID=3127704 RepID=UPI00301E6239
MMRFDKVLPSDRLKPYIRHFIIAENPHEHTYKVLPSMSLVLGFQYTGRLSVLNQQHENSLAGAGITGMADTYKVFKNSAGIGTILVYFTEIGFAHFSTSPAHELFNQSVALDNLFDTEKVREIEEKLALAQTDKQRIQHVEQFLVSQLKDIQTDKLVIEAVKLIYSAKGNIRIKELNEKLFISQSPFEKRFRKLVGTTPKKFASIVRLNTVINALSTEKSLIDICYENHFFDQAHFIKDFRQYTGDTPENFKRSL